MAAATAEHDLASKQGVTEDVFIWIAAAAATGMMFLALRSMAYAFGASLGPAPRQPIIPLESAETAHDNARTRLGRGEVWMLVLEILFSIGMILLIIGLAYTASLPAHLIAGALLAQVAVIGAVLAPPVAHAVAGFSIRPAALALGIAQLAHVAFFIRAIQAFIA